MIKYTVLLFIVLLVGYSQVFAGVFRSYTASSSVKQIKGKEQYQIPGIKSTEIEDIYIEEKEKEEDEQFSLKEIPQGNAYASFFYSCLPGYFFQHINNDSSLCKHLLCFSFFRSPYLLFGVFRL